MPRSVRLAAAVLALSVACALIAAPSPERTPAAPRAASDAPGSPAIAGPRVSAVPTEPAAAVLASQFGRGVTARVCPERPLTHSPVPPAAIKTLGPLGSLVPPDHVFPTPHMYFYVGDPRDPAGTARAELLAPADMTLTSIAYVHYEQQGSRTDHTDYDLTFVVCQGLELYFIHVAALTHPAIVAAAQANPCPRDLRREPGRSFCGVSARAEVRAGDVLGHVGDAAARTWGVDLGVRDFRLANGRAFAAPDRQCGLGGMPNLYGHCYVACPLDYATENVRRELLPRFADSTGRYVRTQDPVCGAFYTDRLGTAQGRWFATGAPAQGEGPHLHLGDDAYGSGFQEFSMGTSVPGVEGGAYFFKPAGDSRVNPRFVDVRDDAARCYESLSRALPGTYETPPVRFVLVVQLAEGGTRLSVERQDRASCGSGPFSTGARAFTFER